MDKLPLHGFINKIVQSKIGKIYDYYIDHSRSTDWRHVNIIIKEKPFEGIGLVIGKYQNKPYSNPMDLTTEEYTSVSIALNNSTYYKIAENNGCLLDRITKEITKDERSYTSFIYSASFELAIDIINFMYKLNNNPSIEKFMEIVKLTTYCDMCGGRTYNGKLCYICERGL